MGFAQNQAQKYKPGIYKTIKEFKDNNPSFELVGKLISGESSSLGLFLGKSNISSYSFEFSSIPAKKRYNKQIGKIFGFSDGKNLFIQSAVPWENDFDEGSYFKVKYIGKNYAYFDFYIPRNDMRGSNGRDATMAILLSNGDKFILTKRIIKNLIKKDKELFKKFKNTYITENVLKEYLRIYDKRL